MDYGANGRWQDSCGGDTIIMKCRICGIECDVNRGGIMRDVCGPCYLEYKREIREGKKNRYGKVIAK